jgi:DNA-binding CsgD family transcriptional regulator
MTDRPRDTAAGRESGVPELGPPADLVVWRVDLGDGQELALFEVAKSDCCPRATGLTAAEGVVLGLAAAGLSNAEIAGRRGVSPRTVANQIASVFSKLHVHSRPELQAWLARARGRQE